MKTIILKRATAARIWNSQIDADAVAEILAAAESSEIQDGAVAVILQDDTAARWLELLRVPPVSVPVDLARALEDAFVLALGIVPQADNRWVVVRG
jgi:uncharacterized protein YdeI (YjbR/CyaY-like superfamily)